MNRMFVGVALLLVWHAGHAQSIYKCRDVAGQPLYQSAPCTEGAAEKRWDTEQRPPSQHEQQRRTAADAKVERDRRALRRSNASTTRAPTRRSGGSAIPMHTAACQRARKQRDQALARMGLNRSFDAIRALDAAVWDACK